MAATASLSAGDPTAPPDVILLPEGEQPPEHLRDENREFQGIPGIDGAANGRLWATWYGGGQGEDANNVVMLATSGDDGATWSEIRVIVDADEPVRCFDPVVWVDPRDRLWLFWGQAITHGINAHTWAMVTENPGDSHPEWREPFIIGPGVMMNKPTVTENGEWHLPISDWEGRRLRTEGAATSGTVVSRDEGKTFEALGAAYVPVEHRQYDEQMLVERSDGSLLMWVRTRYGIGESVSNDGGVTWSELTPSEVKHPVARFFIRKLQSDNLLLVKHGPLDEQIGRSHLTAFVSRDEGKTWEGGLVLEDRQCSYPDGFQADDGTIRIIYDRSRRGDKEILMAAFTEEDALAGRPVTDRVRKRVLVNQATGDSYRDIAASIEFRENNDGEELLTGNPAQWRIQDDDSVEKLELNATLFNDRDYRLAQLPEELEGMRFIKSSLRSTKAVCTQDGVVYVLTPSDGRNNHSLHDELLKNGFTKATVPEFLLFAHSTGAANACSTYQKQVSSGETLEFGPWGVIVMPEG